MLLEAAIFPIADLRWLYIDFNSYFASVEQQLQPVLRNRPVIVVPVETDATCAIAASYEAKSFGIRTGTPVWEAKKLCPDVICVLAKHEHYVDFHHRIHEEVERHIPVSMTCSIDEVACRLMDNENSPERSQDIARSIKAGLAAHVGEYVRCSIGIGPNRWLAKVATDLQKPNGLTSLPAAALPGRLLELELRDLPGIGRNIERRLLMHGIGDMATLWAQPASRLRRIWGSVEGERMWHLLRGVDLPDEETQRRTVGHSHVMSPELRAPQQARYVARRLLMKACSRLRRLEHYAGAIAFSARLENGPRLSDWRRCYRAQDNGTFLIELEKMWLDMFGTAPKCRIKKVSLTLFELEPCASVMPQLFEPLPEAEMRRRMRSERVSRAMDIINQKFGRDTVAFGLMPDQGRSFSGTKVAFTRIPDKEEFLE